MTENKSADNITKALTLKYGEDIAASFVAYINDEAFDEDTLKEDIEDVTADDLANCSVVEHLADGFPKKFNTEKQKELLQILQNALNGIFPKPSAAKVIDPNSVAWGVTKQQAKDATEFITKHCPKLIEDKEKHDKALMDVLAIGNKNDIPLLNWLTDTYSRYRVNNFYLSQADIATVDWVKKYPFFNSLSQSNKTKTLEKLNSSIKSFYKRMFPPINLGLNISVIDDNIADFVDYYIAMNEAIDTLSNKNVVPFQIDLWIIPKNVESSIEYKEDPDPDEEDEIGVDCIGNIDYRLKQNKFKYEAVKADQKEKLKRVFVRYIEMMLKEERKKRLIIYVDRRNPKYVVSEDQCEEYVDSNYGQNPKDDDDTEDTLATKWKRERKKDKKKTWHDTVYFVQSPDKLFNELPSRHSAETSFWASTQCMLPKLATEKNVDHGFGCRNDFNGYQFMLSWHCDSQDVIRNYWFSSCWGSRFFPGDCAMLWPKYFEKKGKVKADQTARLKKMKQCNDEGFQHWFESTTKSKLILFE